MNRGWTLIEALIGVAIVGMLVAMVFGYFFERRNCLRYHYEPTGGMTCRNYGSSTRCEPDTRFVCDEYRAEAP